MFCRARHCVDIVKALSRARHCGTGRRLRRQIWPPPTVYIAVIVPRADLKASHVCLLNGSVLLTVLRRPPLVPLRRFPFPPLDQPRCQAHITVYRLLRRGTSKSGYTSKDTRGAFYAMKNGRSHGLFAFYRAFKLRLHRVSRR